jgi:hypothetical protein
MPSFALFALKVQRFNRLTRLYLIPVGRLASFGLSKFNSRWQLLLHGLGLSSLGTAIILQSTVFAAILRDGYFRAVEQNLTILSVEIAITGFAAIYFVYLLVRFLRLDNWSNKN